MAAVEVLNGFKYYGSSVDPNKKIVLNYLNMSVMNGSIYGLLGASGCGKTTLLSCLVGQKKLHSGSINVFGTNISENSGVIGPRIGYMPQDVALVLELTIKESIYYFGRIYGMNEERIYERYKLIQDLLELPPSDRRIINLSGGQQRRVSFACALVHEPELLILDEPTVGLDPILREKIWEFLVETTRSSKLAVIITTHYIEEARQANKIGLMRNGILLAEDSPENILNVFGTTNLEDAFLILSQKQGQSEDADNTMQRIEEDKIKMAADEQKSLPAAEQKEKYCVERLRRNMSFSEQKSPGFWGKLQFTSSVRMKALLTKNFLQLARQPNGIIFMFLFPLLQCTCFYLAIGGNPRYLKLGVVNEEVSNFQDCFNSSLITASIENYECKLNKLSCRLLNAIPPDLADLIPYKTVDEAYASARHTYISGYIHFQWNYTESTAHVQTNGIKSDDASIEYSRINVRLDNSNQQTAFFLERRLHEIFLDVAQKTMVDCGFPEKLGSIPIRFEHPIYSSFDVEFRQYVAPGVILTMIFFLATLVTASVFISDRVDGVWDRTLVAGISTPELLMAHILTQFTIVFLQCIEIIVYVGLVFVPENKGSNLSLITMLGLNGFSGMLFGLLISVYCQSHTTANFVATGTFYPMIIFCGLMWPLEGMPVFLRYVALLFPFTIPTDTIRNIISKGWTITHPQIYTGFLVTILWIILFFVLCLVGLRRWK